MIRKVLLGVLALAALLGLVAYLSMAPGASPSGAGVVPAAGEDVRAVEPAPAAADAGDAGDESDAGPAGTAEGSRHARPAVLEVIGSAYPFEPGNPANEATSLDDADWLHRNGFPDPRSHDYLMGASIEELEQAAELDLRVAVVLAYRMAAAGSYGEQPFVILQDAAAAGSVFALATWGDIHYALPMYRNPAIGNAYYSLAFRRGYFSAAAKKNLIGARLSPEASLYSDAYAEAAWARIVAARRGTGQPPFPEGNMRPGFEGFLTAVEASFRDQITGKQ